MTECYIRILQKYGFISAVTKYCIFIYDVPDSENLVLHRDIHRQLGKVQRWSLRDTSELNFKSLCIYVGTMVYLYFLPYTTVHV